MTPDERIARVVEMLEEDAARLRGAVPWDVVLRVCEKSRLDATQLAEVRRRLIQRQVDIAWEQDAGAEQPHAAGEATAASEDDTEDPIEMGHGADALADSFSSYLAEAGQHELLDAHTERELMRRIRAGQRAAEALTSGSADPETTLHKLVLDGDRARVDFIQANLRLVLFVAKQVHRPPGIEIEDLVQDGNLGLIRAVEKFDHERGLRFSTYAMHWIRAFMQRAVVNRGRLVRLPVHIAERMRKLGVAKRAMRHELRGQDPTIYDLAARLGWHPETVQFIEDVGSATPVSLDREVGDNTGLTVGDRIGAPAEQRPDSQLVARETDAEAKRALKSLPEKLRVIVEQRFGLDGQEERTLKEIGDQYGLSRERIRQLEVMALDTLRAVIARMAKNKPKSRDKKAKR